MAAWMTINTGCATIVGTVASPVAVPTSWARLNWNNTWFNYLLAPLCVVVAPFGPISGLSLGIEADLGFLKTGSYHGILETRKRQDGSLWCRRSLPFSAVFDPCAYLMRMEWERMDPPDGTVGEK